MNEYTGREKEIEARVKAATPEPWDYCPCSLGHPNNRLNPIVSTPAFHIARLFSATATFGGMTSLAPGGLEEAESNADFIAHAREDIPYLLAQLREAREKLAAVGRYSSELWAQPHGPRQREIVKDLDRILKGGD